MGVKYSFTIPDSAMGVRRGLKVSGLSFSLSVGSSTGSLYISLTFA